MGLSQPLWLSLRPNPLPMLHLRHGTDITMVVGQDIMVVGEGTEDTMDMADTTDMVLDTTDTVTWENALLMQNPKLMPKLPLRLMRCRCLVLWWLLWTPLQIRLLRFGISWILRTSLRIRIPLLGLKDMDGVVTTGNLPVIIPSQLV